MTYRGRIKNGIVELDGPAAPPEGTEVEVHPVETELPLPYTDGGLPPPWGEVFKDVIGKAEGLPTDMARNHDHYVHGAPER